MLRPYHPCQIETIPNPTCFFHWHIVELANYLIGKLSFAKSYINKNACRLTYRRFFEPMEGLEPPTS